MSQQRTYIQIGLLSLLICLATSLAALWLAEQTLSQAFSAISALLVLIAAAALFLAQRQPADLRGQQPAKTTSLSSLLLGFEQLLAGELEASIEAPSNLSAAEQKRIGNIVQQLRQQLAQIGDLQQALKESDAALQATRDSIGDSSTAAPASNAATQPAQAQSDNQALYQLSQALKQLMAKLQHQQQRQAQQLEGQQDQLAAIKQQQQRLSERGRGFDEHIQLLKDLAEQQAILALNAAIQASRSEEEGLSVIADELQRVGHRHSDANRQLEESLQQLHAEIKTAQQLVDHSRQQLAQGPAELESLAQQLQSLSKRCQTLSEQGNIGSQTAEAE